MTNACNQKLALFGGPKTITLPPGDIFTWPIITQEDEDAVLDVLRKRAMSGTELTKQFEAEFKAWNGTKYALGYCNGTAALHAALWACGVGPGDEIICPSITYWASAVPALSQGAAVNFADIDPETLCIDPNDIEHRICKRTKAIMVVHYAAYPADMDPIMAIARKHNIKVIEDVSHAQGALYKGRMCDAIGDIGAMSLMSGKSLAIGEASMVVTNDRLLYERCVAFGHYERTGLASNYNVADKQVTDTSLTPFAGLPLGGFKHRMHQMSSACGRVQLKHYPQRMAEIQKAMNYFWDLLEGVPGIGSRRPAKDSGSTKGGWYAAKGRYYPEQLGGLTCERFCQAVTAEGFSTGTGTNKPLHLHNVFHTGDSLNAGKPTMIAFTERDVRQGPGTLPVSENIHLYTFRPPWFFKYNEEIIREYADAFRKVALNADKILAADKEAAGKK